MEQVVFLVVTSEDGGYEANALGHRIHTQGDNLEDLNKMVRDAIWCHFGESAETIEPVLQFVEI